MATMEMRQLLFGQRLAQHETDASAQQDFRISDFTLARAKFLLDRSRSTESCNIPLKLDDISLWTLETAA